MGSRNCLVPGGAYVVLRKDCMESRGDCLAGTRGD